MEAEDCLKGVE
jgi:hypothetical protein